MPAPAAEPRPWQDGAKPDFVLPDVTGQDIALDRYRGRVVLLHFFATWCEPCLTEMPALGRFAARAKETRLTVLAISVADPELRLRRFLEKTPISYPVLLDRDRAVSKAWGVFSLPTTVVLDETLKPAYVIDADFDWDGTEPQRLLATLAARAARHPAPNATATKSN